MIEVEVMIEAEFFDLDPMGVVWHGNYPRFLELARRALFDQMDYGYEAMKASGYAWPITDMQIRYARPVVLGQRILVKASLVEWENRLVLDFLIRDAASGERLTKAKSTQVAVRMSDGEMQFVCPDILLAKVAAALGQA